MALKDIRPALRAFLVADAALLALVKTGSVTRIYPVLLPQGVIADSIVYQRVSEVADHVNTGPTGLARVRLQIDSWSKAADGAQTLSRLVKERLDGYRGSMGAGATLIVTQGVFFITSRDLYDDLGEMHRVSQDYTFAFEER